MKKPHTIKHDLHAVCGNERERTYLNYIEFHDGFAYATNAHVAVIVDLTEVFDCDYHTTRLLDGYRCHRNIWRMLKGKRVEIKDAGTLMFSPTAKYLPSVVLQLEEIDKYSGTDLKQKITANFPDKKGAQPLQEIGVNPAFLNLATNACRFEYNQARLTFFAANRAILMEPNYGHSKSKAIVMPLMLNY